MTPLCKDSVWSKIDNFSRKQCGCFQMFLYEYPNSEVVLQIFKLVSLTFFEKIIFLTVS